MDIKLMIVEDEVLIAEDIADLCEDIGFPPVFVAYRAGQALNYLKENPVDLVLLDINLEDDIDGIEIAEFINKQCNADFIFLTSYSDQNTLAKVVSTNPAGYIVKPFNKEQLLSTIVLVINNKQGKKTKLTRELINASQNSTITEREFEILDLIYSGKTNAEIANDLFLSINTVKYHVKQIFVRLEIKSRIELLTLLRQIKEKH